MRRLPPVAIALGVAGLIPFIGCGLGGLALPAPDSERFLAALLAYGAVILAFLGAVHWGFVLESPAPDGMAELTRKDRLRLVLGVVPALIGWVALLMPLVLNMEAGLAVLLAGHIATAVMEGQLRRRALVPPGYMVMRWGLSLVVVAVLVTVLTLRLLGAKIVL